MLTTPDLMTMNMVHPLHQRRTMEPHPVQLGVEPAPRMDRAHVMIRLLLLVALGTIGCSSLYWALYLGLPAVAALRISQTGRQYLASDAPRLVRALRWLAGAYAYLWLLTDSPPSSDSTGTLDFEVTPSGSPTTSTALVRLLTTLPALFILAVLSIAAGLLWPVGALLILLRARLPRVLFDFFLLTLRWQFRLIAYHLSLVERYPSFEERVGFGDFSRPRAT